MRNLDTRPVARLQRMRRSFSLVIVLISLAAVANSQTAHADVPERAVTVTGYATEPVAERASQPVVDTAYRAALARALDSAKAKARFVAERAGVTLGPVRSVLELSDGGTPICEPVVEPARHRARRPRRGRGPRRARPRCEVIASLSLSYEIR
jgi:uncharacterized protein YggE